jgi:hypothetical protein
MEETKALIICYHNHLYHSITARMATAFSTDLLYYGSQIRGVAGRREREAQKLRTYASSGNDFLEECTVGHLDFQFYMNI